VAAAVVDACIANALAIASAMTSTSTLLFLERSLLDDDVNDEEPEALDVDEAAAADDEPRRLDENGVVVNIFLAVEMAALPMVEAPLLLLLLDVGDAEPTDDGDAVDEA
jgi:hypothetical protein